MRPSTSNIHFGFGKPTSTMASWNFTPWNMTYTLPPLEFATASQITLYVLYSTTILFSVVGNSIVIYVLMEGNRSKKKLNAFLVNLAVADLLMACFCMPYTFTETMLGRWVFGILMCPLVSFLQVVSVSVSIFTNVAIAIDRYRAVSSPLDQRITRNRAKIVIAAIWICAFSLSTPLLVTMRSSKFYYGKNSYQFCDEQWPETSRMYYTFALLFLTYVVPLTVIGFSYYRILYVLKTHVLPGNTDDIRDYQRLRTKKKVIKMLIVIVSLFALSWLPIHAFTVLNDFLPSSWLVIQSYQDEAIFYGVFYACHWLAMSNSLVNPIIYSFMNDYFKADFRYLFHRKRICLCLRTRRLSFRRSTTYAITFQNNTNGRARRQNENFKVGDGVKQEAITPMRLIEDRKHDQPT